jgi:hypothetical protein
MEQDCQGNSYKVSSISNERKRDIVIYIYLCIKRERQICLLCLMIDCCDMMCYVILCYARVICGFVECRRSERYMQSQVRGELPTSNH